MWFETFVTRWYVFWYCCVACNFPWKCLKWISHAHPSTLSKWLWMWIINYCWHFRWDFFSVFIYLAYFSLSSPVCAVCTILQNTRPTSNIHKQNQTSRSRLGVYFVGTTTKARVSMKSKTTVENSSDAPCMQYAFMQAQHSTSTNALENYNAECRFRMRGACFTSAKLC